jgi:hypothetical protein
VNEFGEFNLFVHKKEEDRMAPRTGIAPVAASGTLWHRGAQRGSRCFGRAACKPPWFPNRHQ